jgi:hypothetical protein
MNNTFFSSPGSAIISYSIQSFPTRTKLASGEFIYSAKNGLLSQSVIPAAAQAPCPKEKLAILSYDKCWASGFDFYQRSETTEEVDAKGLENNWR